MSKLSERYRAFAEVEAKGASPLYEALALAVSQSDELLAFISSLPAPKQQPNLVFATVRQLCGTPKGPRHFAELIDRHALAIRALIAKRSTQTNEPGRCAALLPVFVRLPQPMALLEVGAAAGLCLLPDYYGYDYGAETIGPKVQTAHDAPIFPCRVNGATPIPSDLPEIIWRAGIDLNPIDLSNDEQAAWLEILVWPGQSERAQRLGKAVRIAREIEIPIRTGDLFIDLESLVADAPTEATLVIFHTAVLVYSDADKRQAFLERIRGINAVWVSNESPAVFPEIAAKVSRDPPPGSFLLSVDGAPVAFTGPHGQYIDWLEP